jgi:ACT domain-containing protein
MPRRSESKNCSNYHFIVHYNDNPEEELTEDSLKKKYYKTTNDITNDFGISRSTIYNYYTNINPDKLRKNKTVQKIEKLQSPVPIYKKILVDFD